MDGFHLQRAVKWLMLWHIQTIVWIGILYISIKMSETVWGLQKERKEYSVPSGSEIFYSQHRFTSGFYWQGDWVAHTLPHPFLCANSEPTQECMWINKHTLSPSLSRCWWALDLLPLTWLHMSCVTQESCYKVTVLTFFYNGPILSTKWAKWF